MELIGNLIDGFSAILTPMNMLGIIVGAFLGTVLGMLPGLGSATGIALLMPIAITFEPMTGLAIMCAIYYGAMFGGSRSSILLNIPGAGAAVPACFDGYPLSRQGKAESALAMSAIASFMGGMIATIIFTLMAMPIAQFALRFGPPEYFGLMLFALAATAAISKDNLLKGAMSLIFGLMIATIGIDLQTGVHRFTFGIPELQTGIDFIIVIIGVYGLSEVFKNFETIRSQGAEAIQKQFGRIWITMEQWKRSYLPILRSTPIGFFVGVLPGSGGTIGSMMAYNTEKQLSKEPDRFGKGAIEGLAAPEAANNAASVGALIPMMTLGIPGSATTAIMLAAFMVFGMDPGPMLFEDHSTIAWGIVAAMLVGNFICAVINIPLAGLLVRVLSVPRGILYPLIVGFAFVGAYTINFSTMDFFLLLIFGLIGYGMKKTSVPLPPFILAVIIGGRMEDSYRQAMMMSDGDLSIFFRSTYSTIFLLLAVLSFAQPFISDWLKKRKEQKASVNS